MTKMTADERVRRACERYGYDEGVFLDDVTMYAEQDSAPDYHEQLVEELRSDLRVIHARSGRALHEEREGRAVVQNIQRKLRSLQGRINKIAKLVSDLDEEIEDAEETGRLTPVAGSLMIHRMNARVVIERLRRVKESAS